MENQEGLEATYNLLKNVYFPLVHKYLNKEISIEVFDKAYNEAFYEYGDGIGTAPEDLTRAVTTMFIDIDEYWPDYDANNPEDVQYLEEHKHFVITKQQLDERCVINYDNMLAMLKKYAYYV